MGRKRSGKPRKPQRGKAAGGSQAEPRAAPPADASSGRSSAMSALQRAAAAGEVLVPLMPWSVVAVAAILAFRRIGDFDTFWHLAAGRWIVTNGEVPGHDVLSHTVGTHEWTNLQWLFDVVLYALHSIGGTTLLVWFTAIGFTASVVLIIRSVRLSVGPFVATALAAWALVVMQERFVLRPELVTFLYLAAVVHLSLSRLRDDGRRLWLLIPIMLLWVNSHALFMVGLGCIGWTAVATFAAELPVLPAAWRRSTRMSAAGRRRLVVATVGATAACLVNPYFLEGFLFPFELVSRINGSIPAFASIGEFKRPFSGYFPTAATIFYKRLCVAGCIALGAAALLSAAPKLLPARRTGSGTLGAPDGAGDRFDLAAVGIFLALVYLSVQARRNMGIFAVGATPPVAQWLAVLLARAPGLGGSVAAALRPAVAALVIVASVWAVRDVASNELYRRDRNTSETGTGVLEVNFAVHASEFARELELPGKLYNDFTAGGYLTWSQPVEGGVFIDGRLEVYDATFFTSYQNGFGNFGHWAAEADRYDVQTAIIFHRWANRRPLIRWLIRNPAWSLLYYDETAVVFVRAEGNADKIRAADREFPAWKERMKQRLSDRGNGWQTPIGAATGAIAYGELISTWGLLEEAAESFKLAVELGVSSELEVGLRSWVARYHGKRGETALALLEVKRALELAPDDEKLQQMFLELGR